MQQHGTIRRTLRQTIGITVTTFPADYPVILEQADPINRQRVVDFGGGLIDWMSEDWIARNIAMIPEPPVCRSTPADPASPRPDALSPR